MYGRFEDLTRIQLLLTDLKYSFAVYGKQSFINRAETRTSVGRIGASVHDGEHPTVESPALASTSDAPAPEDTTAVILDSPSSQTARVSHTTLLSYYIHMSPSGFLTAVRPLSVGRVVHSNFRQSRCLSVSSRLSQKHLFLVYAPDKTDDGALERRLKVREQHFHDAKPSVQPGASVSMSELRSFACRGMSI